MKIKKMDLEKLDRTTEGVFSFAELKAKLGQQRPMRIKFGADVTAPFLHTGHAVNFWLMRFFQDHGHKVIFLIGDFTTRIGDPTEKSQTRKSLSRDAIEHNAEEFIRQAGIVLSTEPDVFEIRRNSEWYDQLSMDNFIRLLAQVTHSRLIQRDMFQTRINQNQEIYMHEIIYPVLQAYDSVMLNSDLTIVGSDQLFNELLGRLYQEKAGQEPQVVLTTKITPGIDGKEKQSKSLGNFIGLTDTPRNKFGKIMSIPDSLIVPYLLVYTDIPEADVAEIKKQMEENSMNPMRAKIRLAKALVEKYHGQAVAEKEESWFEAMFSKQNVVTDLPELKINFKMNLVDILKKCLPDHSQSAIRRLVDQGAIRLNDEKQLSLESQSAIPDQTILRIGKKMWFRLVVDETLT